MASGGIPPVQVTPPPQQPTPGVPPATPMSSQSEAVSEAAWKRLTSAATYSDKSEAIFAYWMFLAKDVADKRTEKAGREKRLDQLIKMHQMHTVDQRWSELPDEVKTRLLSALVAAEDVVIELKRHGGRYQTLKRSHPNAWNSPVLHAILSGKPNITSTDYFLGEPFAVCMRRLEVLVESRLDLCAYNLTSFLVTHVFDVTSKKPKVFLNEWVLDAQNNSKEGGDVGAILDAHLGLMYRLKKDTMQLQLTLKTLSVEEILNASRRCRLRQQQQDGQDKSSGLLSLWDAKTNSKLDKSLLEFSMCVAAKRKLDSKNNDGLVAKIVTTWLETFQKVSSDLDIEVEKYVSLAHQTVLCYQLGYQLFQKFGHEARELSVEQFLRGFCCDLNKLEVARTNKDDEAVKETEEMLSFGLLLLADMMSSHLTLARECALTAFSLTPREDLLQRLTLYARQSGFVDGKAESQENDNDNSANSVEDFSKCKNDFEDTCQQLIDSLGKGFSKARTKLRANAVMEDKRVRNLEGLVSIQGDLITEAKNYDPVQPPLKSLTSNALGLNKRLVSDLLITINSPRWHILSWVLDWPTLEEHCVSLLRNPDIRKTTQELKYLVIDYTQFDEWSSDEEVTATTGIEKGYEEWANEESDEEEAIQEKGLDKDEKFDFNVIPKLQEDYSSDEEDFDEYIRPEDYLPPNRKRPRTFLAEAEEMKAARSDLADSGVSESLLRNNSSSESVKETLNRVVPGMNDLAFYGPKKPVELDVRVVQVTTTNKLVASTTSSSTSSTPPTTSTTTTTIVPSTSSKPSTSTPEKERKVQYVYKQGGQTVVIDYPMTDDALTKLKKATTTTTAAATTTVVKQQPAASVIISGSSAPKILQQQMSSSVDSLANSLISQITTPVNVQQPNGAAASTAAAAAAEVGNAAKGALPKFQFAFGRGQTTNSTETKTKDSPTTNTIQLAKSSPEVNGRLILQQQLQQQRCVVQTVSPGSNKLQYNTIIQSKLITPAATAVPSRPHLVVPVVSVDQPVRTAATSEPSTHVDLIRQLNMARAQGLVILQQWGDKQVLVHKATGRWIMRQGNRLVTVPPQALGIVQPTVAAAAAAQPKQESAAPVQVQQQKQQEKQVSSTILEQIAEFDSILESKFKTTTAAAAENSDKQQQQQPMPDVIATATTSQQQQVLQQQQQTGPTFVIITPTKAEKTETATTSLLRSATPPSSNSNVNANRMVKMSSSAPTSPAAKTGVSTSISVKLAQNQQQQQQSVSANSSPSAGITSFVKPPPKPQEDPDTLKRIQQILDDYNEQIRNSPDLQNRPAPRRRTNGPPTIATTSAAAAALVGALAQQPPQQQQSSNAGLISPKKKRPSLGGAESPLLHCEVDLGSSSVVQISSANLLEPGQITSLKVVPKSSEAANSTTSSPVTKPMLRQIMVPPSLAASLQASGRQLMVVTGPGGKKMVALKPLMVSANSTNNTTTTTTSSSTTSSTTQSCSTTVTTSSSISSSSVLPPQTTTTTTMSSSPSVTSKSSVAAAAKLCATAAKAKANHNESKSIKSPIRTNNTNSAMETSRANAVLNSSPESPPSPASVVAAAATSATASSASSSSEPPSLSGDRPGTPGLGIPMEMTPGQIMEAEISAATLLEYEDNNVPAASSSESSLNIRRRGQDDDEPSLQSDTLPENLFTQDQPPSPPSPPLPPTLNRPPVITEDGEVDTDDSTGKSSSTTVVAVAAATAMNKRKRLSSSGNYEDSGSNKRTRLRTSEATTGAGVNNLNNVSTTLGLAVGQQQAGMRTRQRNLSAHKNNSKSNAATSPGFCINDSSRIINK